MFNHSKKCLQDFHSVSDNTFSKQNFLSVGTLWIPTSIFFREHNLLEFNRSEFNRLEFNRSEFKGVKARLGWPKTPPTFP